MDLQRQMEHPHWAPSAEARWSSAMAVFDAALDATVNLRGRLLAGQPTTIRRDVEILLDAEAHSARFLEQPAIEQAGWAPRDQEPLDEDRPQVPGYRLLRKLGQGGMASVWAARRHDATDDAGQVAVKIAARSLPAAQWMRLAREGAILDRLHHPHIATLVETGTCRDGRPFLALELIDGQPIDHYCEQHQLDLRGIATLARQICSALEHAHARGIVHCDLKPSNVLVDAGGSVQLLDFSIAKILNPEDGTFAVDPTVGARPLTLRYASPEQLAGNAITPQSDIYSLGVLLTRLIAGSVPEPSLPSLAATTLPGWTASPSSAPSRSPRTKDERRFQTILRTALEPRAHQRYASVALLREDLERLLAASPGWRDRSSILAWARGVLAQCPLTTTTIALVLGLAAGRTLL